MAREDQKVSLGETFSEVCSDLADLFRKELRLARAEILSKLSAKIRGTIWFGLATLLALSTLGLILGALVTWLATWGVALHFAFLLVGAGVALLSMLAYFAGRKDAEVDLTPSRTINQVKEDIETTKEQLT